MKRNILFISLPLVYGFILLTYFSINSRGYPPLSSQKKEDVVHLFNKKNLDGWYTFLENRGKNNDPKNVFSISKGQIRISGEEWGCITTDKEYENYHLITEYRWGGKTYAPRENNARDCGILLHSVGEDGAKGGIWMYSIECQIIEGGTGDFIVVGDGSEQFSITSTVKEEKQRGSHVYDPKGNPVTINSGRINWYGRDPEWKDEVGFYGREDLEKPVGKWNRLECIVKDGTITNILNGKVVNMAREVKPGKGRIQIQSESAEIYFRKVDLIPL